MDKKIIKLLKYINNSIKDDSYKVVEKQDVFDHFKTKNLNKNELDNMFSYLSKHFYIDIKYSDDKVYCFAVKNKTRVFFEKETSPQKQIQKYRKLFFYYVLLAGLASFVGTALAIKIFL